MCYHSIRAGGVFMKTAVKKIPLAAGFVIMLTVVAAAGIVSLAKHSDAKRDPDRRSAEKRMAEYYGKPFTLISSEETEYKIKLSVLADEGGAECRAACGRLRKTGVRSRNSEKKANRGVYAYIYDRGE